VIAACHADTVSLIIMQSSQQETALCMKTVHLPVRAWHNLEICGVVELDYFLNEFVLESILSSNILC